jgi:KDO2-lipid IV(A) lauroyltransferase
MPQTVFVKVKESMRIIWQYELARHVFEAVTLGAFELTLAWLNPRRDLLDRIDVSGAEHLHEALAAGRGALLLGGHFAVMDVIGQALARLGGIDVMYRANRNPAWEWAQQRGRACYFGAVIERADMRTTLRRLKAGNAIWYAADQDYGRERSVFAPFFGVPCASITATARLARFNDSPVLMLSQHRDYAARRWRVTFSPVMTDFPRDDDFRAACYANTALEAIVRDSPEQYLWLHKRFKTRPAGEPSLYP